MNDKYILCKVFVSLIDDIIEDSSSLNHNINIDKDLLKTLKNNLGNLDELESNLKLYLNMVLGFKFDYSPYLKEARVCFENIVTNVTLNDLNNIGNFIVNYTNGLGEKLDSNRLSSIFIESVRKLYSNDLTGSAIINKGNSFVIERPSRVDEEGMPTIAITNIYELEKVLSKFIYDIKNSDSMYNTFLKNSGDEEGIPYIFSSVIRNATSIDLLDIERYIVKYDSFITDTTFDDLKASKLLGTFMGDDIYAKLRMAPVSYETPYCLSFYMEFDNKIVELPNVRFGIENLDDKKVMHILATQSSQDNERFDMCSKLSDCYKSFLGGISSFREYNPSHVISIILTFGLVRGLGITDINIVDYMPFRYQRLVLENHKNKDELDLLQHRLTNKQLYSYLRTCEYFEGIDICSYPELDNNLKLFLSSNISTNNLELKKLYDMSYNLGILIRKNNIEDKNQSKLL